MEANSSLTTVLMRWSQVAGQFLHDTISYLPTQYHLLVSQYAFRSVFRGREGVRLGLPSASSAQVEEMTRALLLSFLRSSCKASESRSIGRTPQGCHGQAHSIQIETAQRATQPLLEIIKSHIPVMELGDRKPQARGPLEVG